MTPQAAARPKGRILLTARWLVGHRDGRHRLYEKGEIVFEDESLASQLRDIEGIQEFVDRMVELGAEHGFVFTAGDVREAMRMFQQEWIERNL